MTSRTDPAFLIEKFLTQAKEHALICLDVDGSISAWMGAAALIFGYQEEEVLGRHIGLLFTPEDLRLGLDKYEIGVALRDGRSEDDRWHVRQDGTRIWVTGAVVGIRDIDDRVVGLVKVVRDRTDLRTRLDAAENRVERTTAFLRTLGHELRNPLAPLKSAIAILERTNSDPRGERAISIMHAQMDALERLTDDLVDVTRLDLGRAELKLSLVDLGQFLKDTCIAFDPVAKQKGIEFQTLVPDGALRAMIDQNRFQQVVLNLLSNALRYTPAGGKIWLKASQEGDEVVIKVEDTGMGIEPEMLPKLFDLFTRETKATEVAPEGLGIGLSVVKKVVELHGGTVQAKSSGLGKGAEFAVRLPVPNDRVSSACPH